MKIFVAGATGALGLPLVRALCTLFHGVTGRGASVDGAVGECLMGRPVTEVALANPRNGIVEIAGPERVPLNEIVARYLKAVGDPPEGRERSRSPIFRRATRGKVARTIGRGAPRPPQSRGVVTPLAERSPIRPSRAASTPPKTRRSAPHRDTHISKEFLS